jgi:sulfotransferase family protein
MEYLRPRFFILGVNKCGTSSLYRYLIAHPHVLPCIKKEPNFFGQHDPEYIASHIDDYYALFPTRAYQGDLSFKWEAADQAGTTSPIEVRVKRDPSKLYITGEASANTFFDVSPSVLHQYLPDIGLIVLIRNPVDRAYSHHRMYQRFQAAGYQLDSAVRDFETDIDADLRAYSLNQPTNYLASGVYVDRLMQWVSQYGWGQVRVIITEELAQPEKARTILEEIEGYLGQPAHDYGDLLARRFNHAPPSKIAPHLRGRLGAFYRAHNRRLREYLGRELPWDCL